jgi:release factor glutamine methyltransferase
MASDAPTTLVQAWTSARDRLKATGIDTPVIDARLLLEAAAGATRADLLNDPHRALSAEQVQTLDAYLARRERREPIAHILGRKGFWSVMLSVGPQVLTPRPDTELVVIAALERLDPAAPARILDLGVGSGAILLAVLAERPTAKGLGIDVSEEALAVARENASNLGLAPRTALLRGDWTAGLEDGGFDLVVSNPPYIRTGEIATLDPEVRQYEPLAALDGGPDGLDAYRGLAPEILRVLKPGASFVVEIGHDQGAAVTGLFQDAGAVEIELRQDLGGRDRVVAGRRPAAFPAAGRPDIDR